MFREAVKDLATRVITGRSAMYERQRAAYAGRSFPEPGEDPELAAIIREVLGEWLNPEPPGQVIADLTRRIHTHLSQENKRKNLVGEGFEDVVAAILGRLSLETPLEVRTRVPLHDLPGSIGQLQMKKSRRSTSAWLAARCVPWSLRSGVSAPIVRKNS